MTAHGEVFRGMAECFRHDFAHILDQTRYFQVVEKASQKFERAVFSYIKENPGKMGVVYAAMMYFSDIMQDGSMTDIGWLDMFKQVMQDPQVRYDDFTAHHEYKNGTLIGEDAQIVFDKMLQGAFKEGYPILKEIGVEIGEMQHIFARSTFFRSTPPKHLSLIHI